MEAAMEILRKKGQLVAAKRSDREAAEGCVLAKVNGNWTDTEKVAEYCQQAGADTLDEYAENKRRIQHTIRQLEAQAASQPAPDSFDRAAFSKKVLDVVSTITRDDVSEAAKNEALRTIVSHIVFNKPSDTIDIYFYT